MQDSGYFRAKLAQEQLIENSPVPYTIIRATQFFEFIRMIAQVSTAGDVVRLPPVQFQPIAADEVASAVADAALAEPANGTIEIAGPDRFTLDEAVRKVLNMIATRASDTDAAASYYGIRVSERTLVPDGAAHLDPPRSIGGSPTSRRPRQNGCAPVRCRAGALAEQPGHERSATERLCEQRPRPQGVGHAACDRCREHQLRLCPGARR